MKKISILFFAFFTFCNINAQIDSTKLNYFDYVNSYLLSYDSNDISEGGLNNKMKREIDFYAPRLAGVNGEFEIANKALTDYARAYSHSNFNSSGVSNKNLGIPENGCYNGINQPKYLDKHWNELGPFGNNGFPQHGQIHNIDFSPNFATDNTMYACSKYGGIWKSTDRGFNWSLLNQVRKLPTTSIGDVEIHPNHPNTIYISTGGNGLKNFRTLSYSETNNLFTSGIFRSTDGGNNWQEIMDDNIWPSFEAGGNIKKMYIDPYNTNTMYLATSEGIWKSDDITDTNPSWNYISYFIGIENDFKGIDTDYSDPNYLYFSGNRLVRYNKSNSTFTSYDYPTINNSTVVTSNISTTNSNSAKVACYLMHKDETALSLVSFDLPSQSFSVKETQTPTNYYQISTGRIAIAASPTNAGRVFYGQVKLYRSFNFLSLNPSFTNVGGQCCGAGIEYYMHGDIHSIEFAPDGTGVYVGTDGGISYWDSETNLQNTFWQTRHNGINNTLIQDFDDSEVDNKIILTGLQDNRTMSKTDDNNWINFGAGDGYNTWIDDESHKYSYYTQGADFHGRNMLTNQDNDDEFDLALSSTGPIPTSPMQNHPKTGKMIFTMREGLYQKDKKVGDISTDTPNDVWSILHSVQDMGVPVGDESRLFKSVMAESNPSYIYAIRATARPFGSNSTNTPYFVRKKPNLAWESLDNSYTTSTGLPQSEWTDHFPLSGLAVSSVDPEHLWITISGYNNGLKVFKSIDAGDSFIDADPSGCLPNLPVNDIVYQDGTNDRVYIATDVGVYTSVGSSGEWYRYGDIPNVRVNKLKINRCSGTLKASTWGRGLFEIDLMGSNGKITNYNTLENSQTWNEDKALTRNLSIGSGKTLVIDAMTLYMPKNARIIVHRGAKLILKNGAKITNDCGEMWDGITVYGTMVNQQPTLSEVNAGTQYSQGVLQMNDATIEHAKEAIRLHMLQDDLPTWPLYTQYSGGVVFAQNSFFINNRRSAEFMKYNTDASESIFENCEFITNEDYRLEDHTPYHITLWENHGTKILNCKFEDQRISISNISNQRATGIQSIDANFEVSAICNGLVDVNDPNLPCSGPILPNQFIGLRRGIHASGTGEQPSNLQVVDNDFENCVSGITLEAMDRAVIVKNRFTQTDDIIFTDGLYLHNSNGITVTKNEFDGIRIAMATNAMGWLTNEVYKNSVSKNSLLENGTTAVGLETQSNNDKLRIDCNDFNYMYYDFYSLKNGTEISLGDQGSNSEPVANTFSNSFTTGVNGYLKAEDETVGSYDYKAFSGVASMNVEESSPNIYPSVVTALTYNPATGCPDIPLGNLVRKDGSPGIGLEAYYSLLNDLDYYNTDDAVIIDNTINHLIAHYQNNKDLNSIITLLVQYPDMWHQVQLASFYTLNKEYNQSKNILTSLMAGDAVQEVKDLADIYHIKNELETVGKSWFELNANDKSKIMNYARGIDHSPATVKARNILYLVDDMFFEEELVFPDMEGTTGSPFNEPEPLFEQYPNPIAGQLNLEYTETMTAPFKVNIYNLLNNVQVYEGQMENNLFTLDVSEWNSGFYSIVVVTQEGEEIYKSSTKIKN